MNKYLTPPIFVLILGISIAGIIFLKNKTETDTLTKVKNEIPQVFVVPPVKDSDHILGNPQANIVFIEYSDTECPYSKLFQGVMHQVIDNYGKTGQVSWIFRHFPIIGLHPKAPKEAEATECAAIVGGNNMFWKYIDEVYATTTGNNTLDPAKLPQIAQLLGLDMTKFNTCLSTDQASSTVSQDLSDVLRLINGAELSTPHLELILKDTLTDEKIQSMQLGFGSGMTIGEDKKHISLVGYYEYHMIKTLIDMILK